MEYWDGMNEEKKRKLQVIILCVVFAVLLVMGLWINLRRGIYVGEDFLQRKNEYLYQKGNNSITMVPQQGSAQFEVFLDGVKESAVMTWTETDSPYGKYQVTITFSDGEVREGIWGRDGELMGDSGMSLWMEGMFFGEESITITYETSQNYGMSQSPKVGKLTLANTFCKIVFEETTRAGLVRCVLLGAVFYIVGALGFLFPEEMHFLFTRWRYHQPELSDAGIWWEKVGAVCLMVMGVVVMFMILLF